MTTNVKVFRSTDTGARTVTGAAPASTGATGSLIGVLRDVLINGYNSTTVSSIVVASNIATVTDTAHGRVTGDCVLVAGATPSGLNGENYITVTGVNTYTFPTTGISDQTATGTITVKKAPLGWTEPFTSSTTNVVVFRMGAGNQRYLQYDERTAQNTQFIGFESMTAVGYANGSGPFPTTAQLSGGVYCYKSTTNDSTARPWIIMGTDKVLFIWIGADATTISGSSTGTLFSFGDCPSYKSGDVYNTIIKGGNSTSPSINAYVSGFATTNSGTYVPRSYTGIGSSVLCGTNSTNPIVSSGWVGSSGLTYPNPVDGGLWMGQVQINEGSVNSIRADYPGYWFPLHNKPLVSGDTFAGIGSLAGKSFLALNVYSGSQIIFETSNTWGF